MKKILHTTHSVKKPPQTKKNQKYKIYYIKWRDAFTEPDEWHDEDSLTEGDYICETVGFLLENNKNSNYYSIASTVTCDSTFCSIINIPKSMIITKKLIELS